MSHSSRIAVALALSVGTLFGAVSVGAAPQSSQRQRESAPANLPTRPRLAEPEQARTSVTIPAPVVFKESDGRGFVTDVWINGAGPFKFAIDTGAGGNLLSQRVVQEANVTTHESDVKLGGLSGAGEPNPREADEMEIAIGQPGNKLPSSGFSIVVSSLPPNLDGIIDPTEVYYPLGFVLDLPGRELRAFDPSVAGVSVDAPPANGAVVEWISEEGNRRPFVMLGDGRKALLDTGSRFGLAVGENDAIARGIPVGGGATKTTTVSDISGGKITARRVQPTTIKLGPMTLSNVPTDVLSGVSTDVPLILGRDALRPFRLTFDPQSKLIALAPR